MAMEQPINAAFIQSELAAVKRDHSAIEGVTLETCVPAMVRFKVFRNDQKNLITCFMFSKEYPASPIIVELKVILILKLLRLMIVIGLSKYFLQSKVMSYKLLEGLTKICEAEAKKHIGKQQILEVVKFARKFIDDNPLCVCSEEINAIKQTILNPEKDEIKLKQKTSQLVAKLTEVIS